MLLRPCMFLQYVVVSLMPRPQAGGPQLLLIFAAILHIWKPIPPSATWGHVAVTVKSVFVLMGWSLLPNALRPF
jgi:hypothetical protein